MGFGGEGQNESINHSNKKTVPHRHFIVKLFKCKDKTILKAAREK
jgi:hypothetical protein